MRPACVRACVRAGGRSRAPPVERPPQQRSARTGRAAPTARRAFAATPPGAPPRAPNLAPSVHPPASGQQNALFLASDDGFATSFPPSRAPEPGRRNRDLGFSRGAPAQTAAFAAPAGRKRLQTRHHLPENRPDPARNPAGYDLHDSPPARPEKKRATPDGGSGVASNTHGGEGGTCACMRFAARLRERRVHAGDEAAILLGCQRQRGACGAFTAPSLLADASIEREERPRTGRRAFFTFAYGFRCWRETWREHRRRSPCSRTHLQGQAPAPREGRAAGATS